MSGGSEAGAPGPAATGGDAGPAELLAQARRWLEQDPDPETRAELAGLVDAAAAGSPEAAAGLGDRFGSRLAFGTAGLRGRLGAGPARMNRLLVAQAAAGLAGFLRERSRDAVPLAVVGYDGRKNSGVFARDTAELMAGAGVRAVLLPRMLPTPVLAFAVRYLGADAGVMVTASHNPAADNGYKVYLGGTDGGSQIVPPADAAIASHILRVAAGDIRDLPRSQGYEVAGEDVVDAYVAETARVASLLPPAPPGTDGAAPRVVYTAMHGVGWETARRVLAAAGIPEPDPVPEQADPDPSFRTVAFPNPEEPGALDLAFARARQAGADLVVANDPDADRLAVAIPDPADAQGWRRLTGNEVGLLLGFAAAQAAQAAGRTGMLAASVVSSPGLAAIARACGQGYADTLTGFKWVSRVPGLIYGFEEALGYLVNPDTVRDKDGISAAVLFLTLAARLHAEGRTVADALDELAERFGAHASDQISLRLADPARIDAIMARLRGTPPAQIAGIPVAGVDDLAAGSDGLPPADVLRIRLVDGSRIMVRPSGTEPKLKIYLDTASHNGTARQRQADAQSRVAAMADAMRDLTG